MTALAIIVHNLSVRLSRGLVISHIDLCIRIGELVVIIGPNGAGKSTLLRCLAQLVPHQGELSYFPDTRKLLNLAYVPQRPMLPTGMTVAEYVLLGRSRHLHWLSAETYHDRYLVAQTLEQLDLEQHAGYLLEELSGGEVQREVLARALAQQASILVLDEPTSALDLGHQMQVMQLIDSLRHQYKLTIVMALHDLNTAARFADQVMLLQQGCCMATGSPDEVLTEAKLSRLYNTPIQVLTGADGHLVVSLAMAEIS